MTSYSMMDSILKANDWITNHLENKAIILRPESHLVMNYHSRHLTSSRKCRLPWQSVSSTLGDSDQGELIAETDLLWQSR